MSPSFSYIEHTYQEAPNNLAFEEAIYQFLQDEPHPVLRIWEGPPCIVLGRGEKAKERVHLEEAEREGISVLRRMTGGGTVVHGPGNLNISFFLPPNGSKDLETILSTTQYIMSIVAEALKICSKAPCQILGQGDLVLGSKKIAGSAQARRKYGILFHLSLLVDFDLTQIPKLLTHPDKSPDYRKERSHLDFVTSLKREGYAFEFKDLIQAFSELIGGIEHRGIHPKIYENYHELLEKKYLQRSWNIEGKSPPNKA